MNTRDLLHLVWSNLRRMKTRVAMTATGVVIGTAAIIILISLAAGLQRNTIESLGVIGDLREITVFPSSFLTAFGAPPTQAGKEALLDSRTLAEFRNLPGVVAVTPKESLTYGGTLRLNRLTGGALIVGIDPTQVEQWDFALASGTDRLGRWQALVGARVASGFNDSQGRPVAEPLDLQGQGLQLILSRTGDDGRPAERIVRLRVTGVLEESGRQDDYTLYLALNDVLELNSWYAGQRLNPDRDGYSRVLVKVATPEQVTAIEKKILEQGFYAQSARSILQSVDSIFLVMQLVFGGIGAIALIVAAFGIANTMTMAIYERTREIGLMKAIGATNRDVMTVFLTEAGSIGLLGGLGGVLVGVGLGTLIDLIANVYLAMQAVQQSGAAASASNVPLVHTPLWLLPFTAAFATLVGMISGIYPAVRAAALSPIAALKHE